VWPELKPSGAPDANNHFDVSGVVVAPSFRASRTFTGARANTAQRRHPQLPKRSHSLSLTRSLARTHLPLLRVRSFFCFLRTTEAQEAAAARGDFSGPLRVLFLSEGNVCRSVLAEALFTKHLQQRGLQGAVLCESKGARLRAAFGARSGGVHAFVSHHALYVFGACVFVR
jgi:hypothetical protein